MKKILFCSAIALMMCSCKPNNDKLIDQYEKAINAGNYEQAKEILDKIDDDKLTNEQRSRILDISTDGAFNNLQKMMLKGAHEAGKQMNETLEELNDELDDIAERD